MQAFICPECGVHVAATRARGLRRYCSDACLQGKLARARKKPERLLVCATCHETFGGVDQKGRRKYCSAACRLAYNNSPAGRARYAQTKNRKAREWRAANRKVSPPTSSGWRFPKGHVPWNKGTAGPPKPKTGPRRGPANNRWKGGLTAENQKWRQSPEYKAWRIAVFRRDHFTCQRCGVKAHGRSTLVAHHLKSWHQYPELRFEVDNGRTLCRPCHAIEDDWIRTNTRGWTAGPHEPRVKGEQHGNAKLTEVQAREIHARRAQGVPLVALAAHYNVSGATICDLLKGRTWKHLLLAVTPLDPSFEAGP